MPSFDVVSEVDEHELNNAVDQANREIGNRYDFKGVTATFELKDSVVTLTSESPFQLKQMLEILHLKMSARKIDIGCLDASEPNTSLSKATQTIAVKQGIDQPTSKKIVKMIKDKKMKVQASIQGEKLRVTGKKRDDLQTVMAFLRESDEITLPLQFDNFRD